MRSMTARFKDPDVIVYGIFAGFGVLFLFISALVLVPRIVQVNRFAQTDGRVVDYAMSGDTAYPIVEFTTQDGRRWQFEEDMGSDPPQFKLEERVSVLYNPANPREATINALENLWLLPAIFGLFGMIFAGIGLSGIIKVSRQNAVG
jgi:hypothetical protein